MFLHSKDGNPERARMGTEGHGRADAIWGCEETNEYFLVVL